jgi:hypothetical protein
MYPPGLVKNGRDELRWFMTRRQNKIYLRSIRDGGQTMPDSTLECGVAEGKGDDDRDSGDRKFGT